MPAPIVLVIFALFLSCNKSIDPIYGDHNPLQGGNQVAEYHIPLYDPYYPPHFPFLFKKIYDHTGENLQEIQCSFWNDQAPASPECNCRGGVFLSELYHDFLVRHDGRKIFLLNKFPYFGIFTPNPIPLPDTVAVITLDDKGRAGSCRANFELNLLNINTEVGETQYYIYKNDRLFAIKTIEDNRGTLIDTINYDKYGNILSFNGNTYQYDYSRKARLQFYCDDLMGNDDTFYLLEYLGFFPEITSPVNIRTHVEAITFHGDLSNHQFDAEGRLTGYDFYEKISIVWTQPR